jgi:inorganic pyrophosphatase
VYILGVTEPLETFTGKVIAAIRRKDDAEDKLVAAPNGAEFSASEIGEAVRFQERWFVSDVVVFGGVSRK